MRKNAVNVEGGGGELKMRILEVTSKQSTAMFSNSCLLDFICLWIAVPVIQTSLWFSIVLLFDMRRD